jgi:hypothetical protein
MILEPKQTLFLAFVLPISTKLKKSDIPTQKVFLPMSTKLNKSDTHAILLHEFCRDTKSRHAQNLRPSDSLCSSSERKQVLFVLDGSQTDENIVTKRSLKYQNEKNLFVNSD